MEYRNSSPWDVDHRISLIPKKVTLISIAQKGYIFGELLQTVNCQITIITSTLKHEVIMDITGCTCTAKLVRDFSGTDEDSQTKYELLSQDGSHFAICIYCCEAGGVKYTEGRAEVIAGSLHLFCETPPVSEIQFEICPWQLTYEIDYRGPLNLETVYFHNEEAQAV